MYKTALITGASSGLGREFADILAEEGYDVVLVSRSKDKLEEHAKAIEKYYGVNAYVIAADLSKRDAARYIYEFTKHNDIQVDILINNAGFGDYGHFIDSDWDRQENMINVNITSLAHLCHLYGKDMANRGFGRIMNVASVAGFMPGPMMANYYATKNYVLSLSEALAVELRKEGVTVTALCPGPTETNFEENANAKSSGLFEGMYVMDARTVAEYGYGKMLAGKVVAVPGITNKALVAGAKHAPKGLVRNLVYLIQKGRRG